MELIKNNKTWIFLFLVFTLSAPFYTLIIESGSSDSDWLVALMFMPALASVIMRLLTKEGFKNIGWRVKAVHWLALAVFLPLLIEILVVVVAVQMGVADFNTNYISIENELVKIRKTGLLFGAEPAPYAFFAFNFITSIVVACLLYLPLALGEELGWRGYLQHHLVEKFGFYRGIVILGIVWGYWHLPIILMGHNFPQFPIVGGFLVMPLLCVCFSIVWGFVYQKTKSIWIPALFHAALNMVTPISNNALGDVPRHSPTVIALFVVFWALLAVIFMLTIKINQK